MDQVTPLKQGVNDKVATPIMEKRLNGRAAMRVPGQTVTEVCFGGVPSTFGVAARPLAACE